jgi:uncharacterized protein with von Willebrand factor type A (vWA) domain
MYPFASLPANLAAFCDTLRRNHGFRIGPGEVHDAARALEIIDLANERAVRHALRPILGGSLDDVTVFDAAFARFFFPGPAGVPQHELPSAQAEHGGDADGRESDVPHARHAPRFDADATADDIAAPHGGPMTPLETGDQLAAAAIIAPSSYSPLDADVNDAPELPRIERQWRDTARAFVRRLHIGLSRRWRPASKGRRFDLRRTLRAGLQTGGESLSPRWLQRPRRAPRLVLLVDGSRSMSAYTDTALQIAVALASATTRVEVFTFSTTLQRITGDVRRSAAGELRVLERLHHAWAGGTTIGACLRDFLRTFGERMVGRDTLIIIVSDGLDVGMPDVLRDAMRELHRRSAGVVWLNPLLETEGYEPTAAGMSAARPYISTFASVADEAGLARVSRVMRLRTG